MKVEIRAVNAHILNMGTRMPFRYGIASMTASPHLFLSADVIIDGQPQTGIASDHLPPKWFTKNPGAPFKEDVREMLDVIASAARIAEGAPPADSVFDLWTHVHAEQEKWAADKGYPPLLWGFGVSLVERAVIDAFCRAQNLPFSDALRTNALGIRLGDVFPALANSKPADWLPVQPLRAITVRHAVGLGDPLTDSDIAPEDRLDDGLPQSLAESIRAYGLTHFKIKIGGDPDVDRARLVQIASVLESAGLPDYGFTLDGNEQYTAVGPFRTLWESLAADPALDSFLSHLIFVEQPLHRDATFTDDLLAWEDRPPIIIDEAGGALNSLPRALACGYVGTSHKNCKGVFKGIASACLIAHHQKADPASSYTISAEDLSNVGPVALLQDLTVIASLGIPHAERNGHHYFRGLTMLPEDWQQAILAQHGDLYRRHERGFPTVAIRDGRVTVESLIRAPFGLAPQLDLSRFTPVDEWTFDAFAEEFLQDR